MLLTLLLTAASLAGPLDASGLAAARAAAGWDLPPGDLGAGDAPTAMPGPAGGAGALARYAAQLHRPDDALGVSGGYAWSAELWTDLAARVAARPGVAQVEQVGSSFDGRPIWAVHIARPDAPITRRVLVFAGIHALEWISTEVAAALVRELIAAPPEGVLVTVVPLLNPDGRARVERDLAAGEERYRRTNGANVDLNRDFAVNRDGDNVWSAIIPAYYATSPAPLSQPESRAIDALASRGYTRAASLHAFGGYFYTPWAGRFARPPEADRAAMVHLGRQMARAQGAHAYRTRQLGRWGFFFRAKGAEVDHLYGRYGTHTFLVELTRSGWDWRDPIGSFNTSFRWYNPRQPARHVRKGVAAMRALIHEPGLTPPGPVTTPAGALEAHP